MEADSQKTIIVKECNTCIHSNYQGWVKQPMQYPHPGTTIGLNFCMCYIC
jgi:hypothetical protein